MRRMCVERSHSLNLDSLLGAIKNTAAANLLLSKRLDDLSTASTGLGSRCSPFDDEALQQASSARQAQLDRLGSDLVELVEACERCEADLMQAIETRRTEAERLRAEEESSKAEQAKLEAEAERARVEAEEAERVEVERARLAAAEVLRVETAWRERVRKAEEAASELKRDLSEAKSEIEALEKLLALPPNKVRCHWRCIASAPIVTCAHRLTSM